MNERKEKYEWLKNHNICVNCGNEETEPNSIYCYECREKVYKRNREYYKKNKKELNNKNKDYNKQRYYELKEKGICTKCGKRKITKCSKTLCIDCWVKRKKRKDKRWNNEIPRSERPDYDLCYICGKKKNNTKTICDECFIKMQEKMKILNNNPTNAMLDARERYSNYCFEQRRIDFLKKRYKNDV